MSYLRFQHVFVGLLGLSALSAFVVPPKYTYRIEPNLQAVFAPVARTVRQSDLWTNRHTFV